MVKRSLITLIISLATLNVMGQNRPVRFDELELLQTRAPKPVVVLIRTSWCKYCHAMQNTMIKKNNVAQLLATKFYTIFLDAEEKKDIFFAGREFKFKQGVNELAAELGAINGRISYPTLCILNARNEIIYQYDGFLSAQALEFTLKKILED